MRETPLRIGDELYLQNRPTIPDPPTQAEVQALRDTCEELAAEVRALAVQLLLVFPVG